MTAPWVFRMRWTDLLFAHWPLPPEVLRSLVPAGLEVDTFEGQAWIGIVPFRMEDVAPRFLPAPPGPGAFPELNVRTYVRHGERRGVWFLSLDAASRLAVEGARAAFHLPYYRANMRPFRTARGSTTGRSGSTDADPPPPLKAAIGRRDRSTSRRSGSLAAFLTDRRGLYATDAAGRISWTAIRHAPWPLQPAEAEISRNTMAEAHGIELPSTPPLLYYSRRLDVQAWWPRRVRGAR